MASHWWSLVLGVVLWISCTHSAEDIQHALISEKEICMDELGCFKKGGDFQHPIYRPIDVLPHDRKMIDTQFNLFTKKNVYEAHKLSSDDKEGLKNIEITPDGWLRFIVHGFVDTENTGLWQDDLKTQLLLNSENDNCIIVDWSGGNKPPYVQATANTRVVGAEIACLVKLLVEHKKIDVSRIHIIGHSLGSHIAGYAGDIIKKAIGKVGRLTGLDPAEPYFQNMPITVRLDPDDADFVDVIHSDAKTILLLGFGMEQQVGHIDFYPNNGKEQPGCKSAKVTSFILSGLVEGGRRFVSCNHQRAIDFFMSSLKYKQCVPVGIGCSDWNSFLEGRCTSCGKNGSNCGIMGIRGYEYYKHKSDELQPKKYLVTTSKEPFCKFHYAVSVKLSNSGDKDEEGKITVTLNGKAKDAVVLINEKDVKFTHGSTYKVLYNTDKNLGTIESVSFSWKRKKSIFKPLDRFKSHSLSVDHIEIISLNVVEPEDRKAGTSRFCYGANKGIPDDQNTIFVNSC